MEMEREFEEALKNSKTFLRSIDKVITDYPKWRTVVVDLEEFDEPDIAFAVSEDVIEAMKVVQRVAMELIKEERPDVENVWVEFRGSPIRLRARDMSVEFKDRLVTVEGIVRRVDNVAAEVVRVEAECQRCGNRFEVRRREYKPDVRCPNCGTRCEPDELFYTDYQLVVLQEAPEHVKGGEQPATVEVEFRYDHINRVRPGDRVKITAVPRVRLPSSSPRPGDTGEIVLEAHGVERSDSPLPEEDLRFTQDEIEQFEELAEGDPLGEFVEAVAPHIHGHEVIKKAVSLQLFSCVEEGQIRERVHVLIVGDPATAKSQILQHVTEHLAPRGVYVSAQHVTGAGLTAAAERTEDGWTLEAGAVVMADGGMIAIDELDKASRSDLNALLEAMESGKISVAKAGITTTLNARCAVLAAANPEAGRWQGGHPIEEINLDPALLSRFDVILFTRDEPDPEHDRLVAERMMKAFDGEFDEIEGKYGLLRRYVLYATKELPNVTISEDAREELRDWFVSARQEAADRVDEGDLRTVPVTRRQMGSVLRLARASARMRLSETVDREDVSVALSIIEEFMKEVMQEDGVPDADVIETGKPKSVREVREYVLKVVRRLAKKHEDGVPKREIVKAVRHRVSRERVEEILDDLVEEGTLLQPRPGVYLPV